MDTTLNSNLILLIQEQSSAVVPWNLNFKFQSDSINTVLEKAANGS